jgi:hypothetical protein
VEVKNMEVKYTVWVSPAEAQQYFGEPEAKIKATLQNAEILAQRTEGDVHFDGVDGANIDYEHFSSLRDFARGILDETIMQKAIAEKTLTPVIDLTQVPELEQLPQKHAGLKAEQEQRKLAEQREAEEKQRREFARKQAHELLAEDFAELNAEIKRLEERLDEKDNRISRLAGYLEALIKASDEDALEQAGLIEKRVGYGEDEEPELTAEQQEALETAGLDC